MTFARFRQSPIVSSLLTSQGVHPRRFWILIDLFRTLSTRQELSNWGRMGLDLWFGAVLWLLVNAVVSATVLFGPSAVTYLSLFMFLNAFILLIVLFFETAAVLTNPLEALVLAHQPINGATYTFAKLTHLLRILGCFGLAPNIIPALVGLALKDVRVFYPINHLVATGVVSISIAILWISFFGLVIRVVPASNLKTVVRRILLIPAVALMGLRFIQIVSFTNRNPSGIARVIGPLIASIVPALEWPAQFFLIGHPFTRPSHPIVALSIAAVLAGLLLIAARSLSADYLIRVHEMVLGGLPKTTLPRRTPIGDLVAFICGTPSGRAGFEYVRRMLVRDWQFMRRIVRMLPLMAGGFVVLLNGASPFGAGFSPAHLAPHLMGMSFVILSFALPYGTEYKGGWIFLLVRWRSFEPFARGLYFSLWFPFVLLPHAIAFFWHSITWGPLESASFVVFSLAVASLYLGIDLRRVDGMPFGKPHHERGGMEIMEAMFLLIGRAAIAAAAIAVQWFFLFRSPLIILLTTAALAATAFAIIRVSLNNLATAIRHQLSQQRFT
jgi:hypothetical protein